MEWILGYNSVSLSNVIIDETGHRVRADDVELMIGSCCGVRCDDGGGADER